jgi:hypothetical protein
MAAPRRVPPRIARQLRPANPTCHAHCKGRVVSHLVRSGLVGEMRVLACPGGAVSLTSYEEWSNRDPTPAVARELRRRAKPASLVRAHDLRTASRHGPELGRAAERALARARPVTPVRVVYWRVYPFRRRGVGHRLFACFRHGAGTVVFYAAPTATGTDDCPVCRRTGRSD